MGDAFPQPADIQRSELFDKDLCSLTQDLNFRTER